MRMSSLKHKFVAAVPDVLEDGVLYIALDYRTIMHKCCCGCGQEVSTPLGPTDWKMTFDGVSVSIWPSVGNWSLACRSHYVIDDGKVQWAGQWSDEQIEASRLHDRMLKNRQSSSDEKPIELLQKSLVPPPAQPKGFFSRARKWLRW